MAWTQVGAVLEAADAADTDTFGVAVALSADGAVLAVGSQQWEGAVGLARGGVYIYDRVGGAWVQRGAVLEAADAANVDGFGVSVALSADGAVLAVGAYQWEGAAGTNRGGVYIYDRVGSAWVQRGAVIEAPDAADTDYFGISVALSAGGNILAVGAYAWEGSAGTNRGGVYIYDWDWISAWVPRGAVLEAADAADNDNFGRSVALSAGGDILAVGASLWESAAVTNQGGVYVYDWDSSGGAWVQRGAVLVPADTAAADQFGASVALSADGAVLAVGAPQWEGAAGTNRGGVYIYDLDASGSAWVQRGAVLEAADAADYDNFGVSVTLRADGAVLGVGASNWENLINNQGGVYSFADVRSGVAAAPVEFVIYASGIAAAPIEFVIYASGVASAPIEFVIEGASGYASAPILCTYAAATGYAAAPIEVMVKGSAYADAPVAMLVIDPGQVRTWDVAVTFGGEDISSRLVGQIMVEAEEDCARIAEIQMLPATGPIDAMALCGPEVTIDVVMAGVPVRLFTGRADTPAWDPTSDIITVRCHDDRQNRVAALSVETIAAVVGGRHSVSIHGEVEDHLDYAMARLSTVPASLDLSAYGAPRVTAWDGQPVYATIGDGEYLDGSMAIDLPARDQIRNLVRCTVQYRYTRLRDRRAVIGWSAPGASSYTMQILGWQYPTQSTLQAAAEGTGWSVMLQSFSPPPATVSVVIEGETHYMDIDADKVASYVARLAQRHAQTITEEHILTVSAPVSIAANGEVAEEMSGTIASDWDGADWETDFDLTPAIQSGEIDWAPDVPRTASAPTIPGGGWLSGGAVSDGPWSSPQASECGAAVVPLTVRDTFDNAASAMLDMARVSILRSHRSGRVRATLPIAPALDLVHALAFDSSRVQAAGKVVRVRHVLDLSAGSAITEAEIAISGSGGVGLVSPSPLDPPAQPEDDIPADPWTSDLPGLSTYVGGVDAYSPALSGLLANCPETYQMYVLDELGAREYRTVESLGYTPDGLPVTGFRVSMPGVTRCNREAATITAASEYVIAIPEDGMILLAP